MIVIDNKIVSDELLETEFVCNLHACKGACCIEGDAGAPLEANEILLIKNNLPSILPFLSAEGVATIQSAGFEAIFKNKPHTQLIENKACVFISFSDDGKSVCGIEKAWEAGESPLQKPISCHLYPIRISQIGEFEALNYDSWDICASACTLGKSLAIPVFQFLKEALIRKYGVEFYSTLEQAFQLMKESEIKAVTG